MGRKRKKNEEGSLLLMIVVAVLLAAPIALLAGRLFFVGKVRAVRQRLENGERCFDLSEDELTELRYKKTELHRVQNVIRAAMRRGTEANLSVNKDGSFSARSNLGKSIRTILEKNEPLQVALAEDVERLENIPQDRWNDFSSNVRQQLACDWGLMAWLAAFILNYAYSLAASREPSLLGSAMLAGFLALIAYAIGFLVNANAAAKLTTATGYSA